MKTFKRVCWLWCLCLAGSAQGVEYACGCVDDTSIYAGDADNTTTLENWGWGNYPDLYVGDNSNKMTYRSLLRFSVAGAGVAANAVTGATLRLVVSQTKKVGRSQADFDVRALVVHTNNAAWTAGTSTGSLVAKGGLCWNALRRNERPWFGEEGIGTNAPGVTACAGKSRMSVANVQIGDVFEIPFEAKGLEAVWDWMAGRPNAGLLLVGDERHLVQNAVGFHSFEASNAAVRPQLVLHTVTGEVVVAAGADTFMMRDANYADGMRFAEFNYGVTERLGVGVNNKQRGDRWQSVRSLLRFDVSAVGNAVVTGAVVRLFVHSVANYWESTNALSVSLARVVDDHAGWREGSRADAPAPEGELCWNWLERNRTAWSGDMLPPVPGPVLANRTFTSSADLPVGACVEFPLTNAVALAQVQRWCDGELNAGLWLVGENYPTDDKALAAYFCSSEYSNAARRPQLVVYTQDGSAHVAATASADNFFFGLSSWKDASWGKWNDTILCIGLNNATDPYRALLRFDLAGRWGERMRASRATVTLTPTLVAKIGTGSFEARLHVLAAANAAWIEGTANASVETGSPCWNHLAYDTVAWTGGAGIGRDATSAGIELTASTLSVAAANVAVGRPLTFEITDRAALRCLDRWVRGEANAGFLVTTCESTGRQNALQVASREHRLANYRPQIEVWAEAEPRGLAVVLR